MKKILLLAVILAVVQPATSVATGSDELRTSKTGSSFSVQAEYLYDVWLSGNIGAKNKTLKVKIDEVKISVPKGDRELAYLTFGLAMSTEKGWKKIRESERYNIDRLLKKNETLTIRDIRLSFPASGNYTKDGLKLLELKGEKGWLVFTIGLKSGGTTYTHAGLDRE